MLDKALLATFVGKKVTIPANGLEPTSGDLHARTENLTRVGTVQSDEVDGYIFSPAKEDPVSPGGNAQYIVDTDGIKLYVPPSAGRRRSRRSRRTRRKTRARKSRRYRK